MYFFWIISQFFVALLSIYSLLFIRSEPREAEHRHIYQQNLNPRSRSNIRIIIQFKHVAHWASYSEKFYRSSRTFSDSFQKVLNSFKTVLWVCELANYILGVSFHQTYYAWIRNELDRLSTLFLSALGFIYYSTRFGRRSTPSLMVLLP